MFIDKNPTIDKTSMMDRIAIGLGFPLENVRQVVKTAIAFFLKEPELEKFKKESSTLLEENFKLLYLVKISLSLLVGAVKSSVFPSCIFLMIVSYVFIVAVKLSRILKSASLVQ